MKVEVTMTATIPVDATDEQIQEWIEYCTHNRGGISIENPLSDYDMQADDVNVR